MVTMINCLKRKCLVKDISSSVNKWNRRTAVCVRQVPLSRFPYILNPLKNFHHSGRQKQADACYHIDFLSSASTSTTYIHVLSVLQLMQQTFNLYKTIMKYSHLRIISFYVWFSYDISRWVQHFFYLQPADSWEGPRGWRISTGCHSGIQQTARTKPVRPLIAKFTALFQARGKITFSSSPRQGSQRLESDSGEGSNRTPVIACRGWHL